MNKNAVEDALTQLIESGYFPAMLEGETFTSIAYVISQEIDWHEGNPQLSGESDDWEAGFIAGLYHIRTLLDRIDDEIEEGENV